MLMSSRRHARYWMLWARYQSSAELANVPEHPHLNRHTGREGLDALARIRGRSLADRHHQPLLLLVTDETDTDSDAPRFVAYRAQHSSLRCAQVGHESILAQPRSTVQLRGNPR